MAKAFIVLKNGTQIVGREDSKAAAEALASQLLSDSPNASFESGKLDKRVWSERNATTWTDQEEAL